MSETNALEEQQQPTELDLLKQRGKLIGLTFSNNISVETLREKIRAKLEGEPSKDEGDSPQTHALDTTQPVGKPETLAQKMQREQMKLVRLRITNLDPKKKDLPGEIITVANRYLGTVRKYIPFGEVTDNGYHVPYCIYTELQSRQFLNIRTIKDQRTGTNRIETTLAREFALEILPPLTKEELDRLATSQIAAGTSGNGLM
jgi:hypothetical protein